MPYEITYARPALKTLRKLGGEIARRILRAIDALADDPRSVDCLRLRAGDGKLRLRFGAYRCL